jgi:transglutaminase-like putative cysteine protease
MSADPGSARARLGAHAPSPPSTFRLLAILSGIGLLWSFVSVFYDLANVGGNVDPFLAVTALALLGGTVAARFVPVRFGLVVGTIVLGAGVGAYLLSVPRILTRAASVEFVAEFSVYLTGLTVLNFLRVDLWAVALAPAPTFACWYFALRRRYDLAALAGGLALGFFALTTDAGGQTTLVGSLSLLGMLAFGGLERANGTWHQLERAALVGLLGLVAARTVTVPGNARDPLLGEDGQTLESTLLDNDESVGILGSIELSPEVRFSVEASEGVYWRVGAHDRYTGDGWIRTGSSRSYDGPVRGPVGPDREITQRYEIRSDTLSLPAVWKPTGIEGGILGSVRYTSLGGLKPPPSETVTEGTKYTITSQRPTAGREDLLEAGTDYPGSIENQYLRLPDNTPGRVGERAESIAGDADTPYEAVSDIERWLESNKGYSLDISRPSGDIVDGFLFSMSEGYCVYFATAMVVMLRTLGIPARFVTGYTTGQRIDSGEWLVRGLNSHAWVEVYFTGIGWMAFDPTPAASREDARESALDRARRENEGDVDIPESRPTPAPSPTPTPTPTPTPEMTPTATPTTESPTNATTDGPDVTSTGPQTAGSPTDTPDKGPTPSPGGEGNDTTATGTTNATGSTGPESGGEIPSVIRDRDRVTVLGGVAALALGAHHFGAVDRISRELWLREQEPTDAPQTDAERAFDRVEHLLERRYRERATAETPRQYHNAVGVNDDRVRRLTDIYERAHYAGTVTREEATEAIRLADDIITGS